MLLHSLLFPRKAGELGLLARKKKKTQLSNLIRHKSICWPSKNSSSFQTSFRCWYFIRLYTILLNQTMGKKSEVNNLTDCKTQMTISTGDVYFLPGNRKSDLRRLKLLLCNLYSFAPTNKVRVWSVYVVHLQIKLYYKILSTLKYHNQVWCNRYVCLTSP